jgi:hypothetical protein
MFEFIDQVFYLQTLNAFGGWLLLLHQLLGNANLKTWREIARDASEKKGGPTKTDNKASPCWDLSTNTKKIGLKHASPKIYL